MLLKARRWVTDLVHWYNDEHRHSATCFVTPSQRHAEQDKDLLAGRATFYELARQTHPQRWSKSLLKALINIALLPAACLAAIKYLRGRVTFNNRERSKVVDG